ncbi:succinylglutamate desuccinylase [Photobacterium jeanii]|uniref:Succinylglutamate desuccinylase n=2 Tax=Vibrionaceae TaxID=641 RepID=A0A178KLH2_9GAMM|nr:succinylglutamate desuccinylase [Photobacterium jeanii]OAN18101.1 succinylglutamate desuccinylase [Photobacterium jeanii]PST92225.1 succinylglutamate desuccinylase [Photobacterium jeanii]
MSSLDQVKAGAFLSATLDVNSEFEAGQWELASGVRCSLKARGVLYIEPVTFDLSSKDIVVSSGVHGDETGPMELLGKLAQEILIGKWQPKHRLLLIIAHPQATLAHTRFLVENMNRLFAQQNDETNVERQLANQLQHHVDAFFEGSPLVKSGAVASEHRWHLDLHSAIRDSAHYTFAVSPYTKKATRSKMLFTFLEQAKIEAVLLSQSPSPTFSWYSAENHGAQALTMELGRVAKLGENELGRLADFENALRILLSELTPVWHWQNDGLIVYKVTRTLTKQSDEFQFNFPASQANFTFFDQGVLLGQDRDTKYFSLEGGEAVVFPNPNVAIGQRACLLVQPTKVSVNEQIKALN